MKKDTPKSGASLNRHKSETVVGTPQSFVDAAAKRYGKITIDLAASEGNAKASRFITKEADSLAVNWREEIRKGVGWLNPPYDHIGIWAAKCDYEGKGGAKILFLAPASVGANWFAEYIFRQHPVTFINGRIRFVGHTQPYPKDLMLVRFGFPGPKFEVWKPKPEELR